jgi:hypothetical protein
VSQPTPAQIARFVEAFNILSQFSAQQQLIRGYGAPFGPEWGTLDETIIVVREWLEQLAKGLNMSDPAREVAIYERLLVFYKPKEADVWMESPHPLLGGARARGALDGLEVASLDQRAEHHICDAHTNTPSSGCATTVEHRTNSRVLSLQNMAIQEVVVWIASEVLLALAKSQPRINIPSAFQYKEPFSSAKAKRKLQDPPVSGSSITDMGAGRGVIVDPIVVLRKKRLNVAYRSTARAIWAGLNLT